MEYNYLYIDDASPDRTEGTKSGLEDKELTISFYNPTGEWESQVEFIRQQLDAIDGIILDLRLNEEANAEDKISHYRGTSIAQELRTLAKEKEIPDIPIILLSAERNLQIAFDKTSSDLFDFYIPKEQLNGEIFQLVRSRLKSLANGYRSLNSQLQAPDKNAKIIATLLGMEESLLGMLDVRFVSKFLELLYQPAHNIAQYLIKHVLEKDGILISEAILAARLGIDTQSDQWPAFLNSHLSEFKYKGTFHEGWHKWWMFHIEDWWQRNFSEEPNMRKIPASRKALLINSKFTMNLNSPPLIEKAKSELFWTVCKGLNKPLDPIDGLLISNQEKILPWEDREYVSFVAALNRINVQEWKEIYPLERNKFEQIKKIYHRERVRR